MITSIRELDSYLLVNHLRREFPVFKSWGQFLAYWRSLYV